MDTQSSDISAVENRESGRSFQSLIVWGKKRGGGGGGNSFANITLAISSRCFSILLLSLGAFHKVLDLRASLLQKVFVLLRVYLLENLNLILIFYKSFC